MIKNPGPIGFCMRRSIDCIICMLAILRSRCYYIPLDPSYPMERINYIINDVKPFAIIYDDFIIKLQDEDNCNMKLENCDICYIIYTSGSTGFPKGVIIEQNSVLNIIQSAINIFEINNSRILSYASIGFDAVGWDIYISLFSGSTLCIISDENAVNPPACHQYMIDNCITFATVTPSFLAQIPMNHVNTLNTLVVMGDISDNKYMDWWSDYTNVFNGYGPTECTIGSTIHKYHKGDSPKNIGYPFDNYKIYILDENLQQCELGEICIAGKGIAIGYHNLDKMTAEKFIESLYGKIYKTGDIGRKLLNGEIEFIGRIDNQIKINGIRIELEEIDNLAMKIPQIERSYSILIDNKIHLFYQSIAAIDNNSIRQFLSNYLHRTVLPISYNHVKKFILTHNGKIDRGKLKTPNINLEIQSYNMDNIELLVSKAYSVTLNISILNPESNFFELGGHSLISHRIVSELKQKNINIDALKVMQYPTIKELSNYIKHISDSIISSNQLYINYNKPTPYQINLLKHYQIHPNDTSYNVVKVYKTTLSIEKIKYIFNKLISAHPVLRTKYELKDDNWHQSFESEIEMIELHLQSENEIYNHIKLSKDISFGITTSLAKIYIYNMDSYCIVSFIKDGSIIDAYSEFIIYNNLMQLASNIELEVDSYIEATSKINNMFNNDNTLLFWKKFLSNPKIGRLPNFKSIICHVKHKINSKISYIASRFHTTPFIFICTIISLMLKDYTNDKNIIFGTQCAIRDDPLYIESVGFLVATLLMRIKVNNESVNDLIKSIQSTYLQINQHKYVTYEQLLNIWNNPVDFMFVYQNIPVVKNDMNVITEIDINLQPHAPFPITWYVYQNENDLTIDIKSIYDKGLIKSMIDTFENILNNIISELTIERNLLSSDLTNVETIGISTPITGTIDTIIAEICKKYPNNISIKHSSATADHLDLNITYQSLEQYINMYAYIIGNKYNIKPGDIIAVILRKSSSLIIILLAILRLGACYVPIDPDYPITRIKYMIDDCNPKIIITRQFKQLSSISNIVDIDELELINMKIFPTIQSKSTPDSLAYIIYTSGSTGNPKACMISHKSIINVCNFFASLLNIKSKDEVWSLTTISFDIMVLEIFMPLMFGAKLLICPQCVVNNPVDHVAWINKHKPNLLQATPTQFSRIFNHIEPNASMKILVGGEQLGDIVAKGLLNITEEVYNVYGPSETTIWSTYKKISKEGKINIGIPIANTKCCVVNNKMKNVPNYVVGELLIGGLGISKGYYKNSKLNIEKFINKNGDIYYRTGDLVRIIDGEIEYVGRNDFQVKIRGHRVELEEVVKVAEQYSYIIRAIAKVFEDPIYHQNVIALYIISSISINQSLMYEFLRNILPINSVPNFIIQLGRFPETLNGKVDTKLLPNPYENKSVIYNKFGENIEPRNEIEKKLFELICSILNTNELSIDESLFNVGFTSIMVPILINNIEKEFGMKISIETVIKNLTIEKIAKLLNR